MKFEQHLEQFKEDGKRVIPIEMAEEMNRTLDQQGIEYDCFKISSKEVVFEIVVPE
jgi:hypothetical protein